MDITLTILDHRASTVTLFRSDGKVASVPLRDVGAANGTAIARSIWAPGTPALMFETDLGDQIVAELPRFSEFAPLDGRSVVYLDQNHWSTLARALHAPHRVRRPAELEAAHAVIDLVRARKIVLPMSAGHMSETCKWSIRAERYDLALTVLQLSAGWQMRDPLDVRLREIHNALSRRYQERSETIPAVFTLEPDAIHRARGTSVLSPPPDFPPEVAFTWTAQTCVSGNFAAMLDEEHVPMEPQPGWVDTMQRFTDWMASEPRKSPLRRARTNLQFLIDSRTEIAEAAASVAITEAQLTDWIQVHSDVDIADMSALGLFREVLREKHYNPGTRWEGNDLADLMYLTCAAGYADHVVGEKNLTSHMERALRRVGRQTRVHRRLEQLVGALQ